MKGSVIENINPRRHKLQDDHRFFLWNDERDTFEEVSQHVFENENEWGAYHINNTIEARKESFQDPWAFDIQFGNVFGYVILEALFVIVEVNEGFQFEKLQTYSELVSKLYPKFSTSEMRELLREGSDLLNGKSLYEMVKSKSRTEFIQFIKRFS